MLSVTYSSVNLVRLVRAAGSSPVRLFALRMLETKCNLITYPMVLAIQLIKGKNEELNKRK